MKKLICKIIGHNPRGPVRRIDISEHEVVYWCARCHQLIYFDLKRGWLKVKRLKVKRFKLK